ncbi:MAG: hypothetical protein U9P71_03840 [Campylobacterota bacterium]|nr:hypothetical protein [Campylobacterota bacterium]
MRLLLLAASAFLLFTGCSKTTAFDFFKMDKNYEKAISNLQSGTIVKSFETEAILSSVYLNEVYPKEYSDGEYFFIALYLSDDKRLFFKSGLADPDYILTLNTLNFIDGEELQSDHKLRALMPINNEWNRYYLIKFDSQNRDNLLLQLENKHLDKIELHYLKDSAIAKKQ